MAGHSGVPLLELLEHTIYVIEGRVYVLAGLGTSEHDLSTREYEEDDLGLVHSVYEAGEQLGLVGGEGAMASVEGLKGDGEVDATRADDVLDLELLELDIGRAHLLDHLRILLGRLLRLLLTLRTRYYHLPRPEDKSCRLWISDADDDSRETTRVKLCIPAAESDFPEVKGRAQTSRGDDVLQLRLWLVILVVLLLVLPHGYYGSRDITCSRGGICRHDCHPGHLMHGRGSQCLNTALVTRLRPHDTWGAH